MDNKYQEKMRCPKCGSHKWIDKFWPYQECEGGEWIDRKCAGCTYMIHVRPLDWEVQDD